MRHLSLTATNLPFPLVAMTSSTALPDATILSVGARNLPTLEDASRLLPEDAVLDSLSVCYPKSGTECGCAISVNVNGDDPLLL